MNDLKSQTGLLPAIGCLVALLLTACAGDSDTERAELRRFVEETINRQGAPVEPVPTFVAYQPFAYSAAGLRSPFQSPLAANLSSVDKPASEIQPDLARHREPLEAFALSSLTLVGTLTQSESESESALRWALIRDGEGSVQRVTVGNYLGHDHGRIDAVTEYSISIVEIVTGGEGRWVESARVLSMAGRSERQLSAERELGGIAARQEKGQEGYPESHEKRHPERVR